MFLTLIAFLAVLSLLVFVHELGHFYTARRFGVRAKEFGFGFPPRVFGCYKDNNGKWKKVAGNKKVVDAVDTVYSVNWIPMGGFVNIGEDDVSDNGPDSFSGKKIWQRSVIISAGVAMNIVLAAILITVGLVVGMPQSLDNASSRAIVSDRKIQIMEVLPDTPAAAAEIKTGDVILSINDKLFGNYEELQNFVHENADRQLVYKIKRGENEIEKEITPRIMESSGRGGIGVAILETGTVRYPWYLAPWEGVKTTFLLTWMIIVAFFELIKGMIFGQGVSADISGPVGIAVMTGQVARMGFVYILQFTALLSINLAIINFLPFPALDGGRILFLIIEKIKGSPVKRELEAVMHNIGFALLMILVLIVTFRDVARFGDSFRLLWERIVG